MPEPGDTENTPVVTTLAEDEKELPPIGWQILLVAAGAVIVAAVVPMLAFFFIPQDFLDSTGQVVILLVGGVIAVMLLLYLGTIILRAMGVASRRSALGMPDGSIRALIAVSLILMFAIIGVLVFFASAGSEPLESKGITAEQIDQLENVQIVSITAVEPAASPERFNVVSRAEMNDSSHDFGLQLLTTVATLVVAVAGFYFGSKSVDQATKSALQIQAAAMRPRGTSGGEAAEGEDDELDDNDVIEAREDDAAEDDDKLATKQPEAPATEAPATEPPATEPPPEPATAGEPAATPEPTTTAPPGEPPADAPKKPEKPAG
jgi:hypothetical protein